MDGRRPSILLRLDLPGLGLLVAVLAVLSSCSSPPTLRSQWRDREVVIDGGDGEWEGAKYYIEKSNVDVGVLNDSEYLYVCMSVVERSLMMQVLGRGMTLWFNPTGNRDKSFGVRYPLGRMDAMWEDAAGAKGPGGRRGGRRSPGEARRGAGQRDPADLGQLQAFVAAALEGLELEMLYDGVEKGRRLGLAESDVVQVRMGFDRGRLIYEMKVRLAQQEPHGPGIGALAGKRLGVGVLTPQVTMAAMPGRRGDLGGGMGGAGVPGGGMAPGGGMRGGMRPGIGEMAVPLDIWFRVELAGPGGPPVTTGD